MMTLPFTQSTDCAAKLAEWGIRPPPGITDLYSVCKYIYEGPPDGCYTLISNGSGYHKLWVNADKAMMFAHIDDFMINPKQYEHYIDGCRVLIHQWDNVQRVYPGISQSKCTYGGSEDCSCAQWPNPKYDGNTCILQLQSKSNYLLLGGENTITSFTLDEPIEAFYSYVANNDMPLPLIVTATRVIMEHGSFIYRTELQGQDLRNIARALSANEVPNINWRQSETRWMEI